MFSGPHRGSELAKRDCAYEKGPVRNSQYAVVDSLWHMACLQLPVP